MSIRKQLVEQKHNIKFDDIDVENNLTFSLQDIIVQSRKVLWLLGVDYYGFSVALKVNGFKPFFYAKCPKDWISDPHRHISSWLETVNNRLRRNVKKKTEKGKEEEVEGDDCISHIDVEYKVPFVGFTNGTNDTLLKIYCHNIYDFNKVTKCLKEDYNWRIYHEDLGFPQQFFQQTGLAFQQWVKPDMLAIIPDRERISKTNIEVIAHISALRVDNDMKDKVPMILKCFIRQKAVSREALLRKEAYQYHPDPSLPFDRTVAVGLSFVWGNGDQASEKVYTLCDNVKGAITCTDEKSILTRVKNDILEFDPDDFMVFPDYYNTLSYLWRRAETIHYNGFQYIERLKGTTSRHYKSKKDGSWVFRSPTRNYIDLQVNLIKKQFFPIEEYNLYRVSTVKGVRKKPENLDKLTRYNHMVNRWMLQGDDHQKIINFVKQDLFLMSTMENEMGVRLEKANTSHVSDTDITETTMGGELIRVYNRLTHFVIDQGHYVNRDKISQQPLRFSKTDRPPSIVDPAEQKINVDLRNECNEALCKNPVFKEMYKQDYKKFTLHKHEQELDDFKMEEECIVDNSDDEEEEKEGGNVLLPSARHWGEEKIIILDFASLYPSIMRAYNISYEMIVYDEEYLDLPGVEYYNLPINNDEVVVLARKEGIIPKLLALLLSARKALKKKMGKAAEDGDTFMESVFNMGQASMKVFCNATYGFCGAGDKSSILSVKEVMYIVTGIGRYLQKVAADYVAVAYKKPIPTIYGDTDSIFCWLKWEKNDDNNIVEACKNTGAMYGMDGWLKENPREKDSPGLPFTWENVCRHFCKFRKKRPDKSDVDPSKMLYEHQVNAFIYLIGEKICEDITDLYLSPVLMEFENLADKVCMNPKKKNYWYRFWDEICPDTIKKIKKTGLPAIKREWCLFTRILLLQVINLLAEDKLSEIKPLIYQRVGDLVAGRIPMSQLTISKLFKGKTHYKNDNSPHFQLALKIEKRCRYVVPPSRISFVVIRGEGKLYERVESPEYAAENNISLDYYYYLKNQLEKPLKKTLLYYYHLLSLDNMFNEMTSKLEATENGMDDFNFSDDDEEEEELDNHVLPISDQQNIEAYTNKILQNRKQLKKQLEDDPMNAFF